MATEEQIQRQAIAILERLGLSNEQALSIFYRQIVELQDFPFQIDKKEKAQLALQSDARRAWTDYKQSGRHATQQDVELWLERLYGSAERGLSCRK